MSRQRRSIATRDLIQVGLQVVAKARTRIQRSLDELNNRPDVAGPDFVKVLRDEKYALSIDLAAEEACRQAFLEAFPHDVQVLGEETLRGFSGWGEERYCVLVDMVDGTDLVKMNLSLWCSAMIIFDRLEYKIICSIVGLPTGEIFYAEAGREGAHVREAIDGRLTGEEYEADGCSAVTKLASARIAFYGQKPANFTAVARNISFIERISQLVGRDEGCRIYDFAGNPMMAKMANRPKSLMRQTVTDDIDAVFDTVGQQLHDVVPGAFIAMKAGASLFELGGRRLNVEDLGKALDNPKATLAYVIAATEPLGLELCEALTGEPPHIQPARLAS